MCNYTQTVGIRAEKGIGNEREMEGINKVFAKCFPDLLLTFAGPGPRIQIENYMPYVSIFESYKLS